MASTETTSAFPADDLHGHGPRGVRFTFPIRGSKCDHMVMCKLFMTRVVTEPWRRLYRLSAPAPESISDRVKGYEHVERWDDVPRPDVGGT